jgi:hypothetical protein
VKHTFVASFANFPLITIKFGFIAGSAKMPRSIVRLKAAAPFDHGRSSVDFTINISVVEVFGTDRVCAALHHLVPRFLRSADVMVL